MSEENTQRKRSFRLPHVYTIVFLLMVVFAVLTWIIPSGSYERQVIETAAGEKEVAVAGTYAPQDKVSTDPETGEVVDLRCNVMHPWRRRRRGVRPSHRRVLCHHHQDQRHQRGPQPRHRQVPPP